MLDDRLEPQVNNPQRLPHRGSRVGAGQSAADRERDGERCDSSASGPHPSRTILDYDRKAVGTGNRATPPRFGWATRKDIRI